MAVKAKRVVSGVGRNDYAVIAADIMKDDHPLYKAFIQWVGDKPITKRKAREFLKTHPQYRNSQNA